MDKPLVSVIVPVFNTEDYLPRCLDSLLCQTLEQIEIIIIDDGSTDSSSLICEKYAKADQRIRLIMKQNEGLSAARNEGIEIASADYLMFVDSDDWVEEDYCKIPFVIAEREQADAVIFNFTAYRKGKVLKTPKPGMPDGPVSKVQAMEMIHAEACCYAVNKLFRKELFNDIRFPEKMVFEDVGTLYRLVDRAENIWYRNESLYNYTAARPGSISSCSSSQKMNDFVRIWSEKRMDLQDMGYDLKDYTSWEAFYFIIHFGREAGVTDVLEDAVKRIDGYPNTFSAKQKIMLAVYRLSPGLFDAVCGIFKRRATCTK